MGVGGSSVGEVVEQARRVADGGFDRVWLSHIFGVDAMTAIAVAGHAVDGLHFGTGVVPTFPRHPHALAQQAMSTWDATGGPRRVVPEAGGSGGLVFRP